MPLERKKIYIGGEYRDTYKNLVKLLRSGHLEGVGAHVEQDKSGNPVICTDSAEYVYRERAASNKGDSAKVALNEEGASWFAPVRQGKAFDDGTSDWKQLIYKVAGKFHEKFSVIEYKKCDGTGNADSGTAQKNIDLIIRRLFGRTDAVIIKGDDESKGSEDIYGASVKLELSGTGQSHHVVMCKIYFRADGRGVTPLTRTEAELINEKLEDAPENDDPVTISESKTAAINEMTVDGVKKLVRGEFGVTFKDALCFSRKQVENPRTKRLEDNADLKTFRALAENARASDGAVTCNSVQVLGISHVEWKSDYYEVAFGGKVALQATVGFNSNITLRCLNCGGANLVTSNTVSYPKTDDFGRMRTVNKILDYSQPDLGITEEELEEIKTLSEIANHLFSVGCNNPRIGKRCLSCVCRSQTALVDGELKCADCPYPEVVYVDYSGEKPMRHLTKKMTFVNDRLAMVFAEEAENCSRCGRAFSGGALVGGRCKLCAGIDSLTEEELARAKRLYFRYKNAFSYTVRAKHLFDKKYCLEDDTALVFALGNETYVLSKPDLEGGKGFIKQPKKV